MDETTLPLDRSALQSMFGDDVEFQLSILASYSDSLVEFQQALDRAFANREAAELRAQAHKMKSSSSTVGAYTLGDYCEQLEAAAEALDWQVIETVVPKFADEISAVRACIADEV